MKNLPVSDSSFAEIISQDLLYADKTAYIFEMIKPSTKCCFLSRPRR
ncbi:MAG: AAA family ATPase, partial [Deltaproteobacteria bacterium]|nr:AAA family ATPase [Deltaproteobacteria bacterium]